jgi:RNA polymerase sigma factor (sigma-70 family)
MRPPPPSRTGAEADKGVRPLTRRNTDTGALYERLPEVEAQVRRALALEEEALIEAIQHSYDESSTHLKDEALCYLIRERLRAGHQESANAVTEVLLRRHAGTVRSRIGRGGVDERHREDCDREIVSQLLIELFDTDSDRSDFAQVRFGLYFERLSNGVISKFRKLQRRERQAESVISTQGDRTEEIDLLDTLADGRALSAEDRALTREALAHLPDHLREVFILRHFTGWQTESNSPTEPSISRYLGVTARTVRNRLRDAEASLRRWREGKQGK